MTNSTSIDVIVRYCSSKYINKWKKIEPTAFEFTPYIRTEKIYPYMLTIAAYSSYFLNAKNEWYLIFIHSLSFVTYFCLSFKILTYGFYLEKCFSFINTEGVIQFICMYIWARFVCVSIVLPRNVLSYSILSILQSMNTQDTLSDVHL